jgi:hypothetical protein
VRAVLDEWVQSTKTHDVPRQLKLYAPRLERFYGDRSVSREAIGRNRTEQFASMGPVRQFDLRNLQVRESSGGRMIATFDKVWEFGTRGNDAGQVRSELVLARDGDTWRIVSERDLRVYWRRKRR